MPVFNLNPDFPEAHQFAGIAAAPTGKKRYAVIVSQYGKNVWVRTKSFEELCSPSMWSGNIPEGYAQGGTRMAYIQAKQALGALNPVRRFRMHSDGRLTLFNDHDDVVAYNQRAVIGIDGAANLARPDVVGGYRGTLPKVAL